MKKKKKLIIIVGATATGKSALAILLAKKFHGEVISADSRQVYRGLNIGTDKMTKTEMEGVPHHLIDIANPKDIFTTAEWKKRARRAISEITERGNVPIVAGGTGFYIDALTGTISLPDVEPNSALREELEKKDTEELFGMLEEADPRRAKEIDRFNKPRLVRALEIIEEYGAVPPLKKEEVPYKILKVGLRIDDDVLKEKIRERLLSDIQKGLIHEVKELHENGLSWKRLENLGLTYRYVARHLQGELSQEQMTEELITAIWQYAKRQKTYFKRDTEIVWFDAGDYEEVEKEAKSFLKE